MVRFGFRREPRPCLCPQGCSGRSCTAWRSWPALWRSGTATRSPAPTTSRGRAARSPAQPGLLDFPSLLSKALISKLPYGGDRRQGDLGRCCARVAAAHLQLSAPLLFHLSSPSCWRMGPRPCPGPWDQIPVVAQPRRILLVRRLRAARDGTILAGPGAPLCLCAHNHPGTTWGLLCPSPWIPVP